MQARFVFMYGYSFLMIFGIINCFSHFNRFASRCFGKNRPIKSLAGRLFAINTRRFMFLNERNFLRSTGVFRRTVLVDRNDQRSIISDRITRCATFGLGLRNMFLRFRFRATIRLHFIRGTFTSGCKFKLVIGMIRRDFQSITSINRSTTYDFLFPFFKVTITFRASQFKDSSYLFRRARSDFIFTCSFLRGLFRQYTRFIRLIYRNDISDGRNNNAIKEEAYNARLGPISNRNREKNAIAINYIRRGFKCASSARFRHYLFFQNRFLISRLTCGFIGDYQGL